MLNYVVDVNLFSKGWIFSDIVMYPTFTSNVTALQDISFFSNIVNDSIDRSKLKNFILEIVLTAIIIILIVPLAYFLRKRA